MLIFMHGSRIDSFHCVITQTCVKEQYGSLMISHTITLVHKCKGLVKLTSQQLISSVLELLPFSMLSHASLQYATTRIDNLPNFFGSI